MKNSREFYSTVTKKFGPMPFNLRSFDSETKAKMGVVECVTHKLVEPFQVLHEKDSKFYDFILHFRLAKNNKSIHVEQTFNNLLNIILSILLDEFVAQFKFTVLLMPNGPHKITGLPFDPSKCTSTHSIEGKLIKLTCEQTKLIYEILYPNLPIISPVYIY